MAETLPNQIPETSTLKNVLTSFSEDSKILKNEVLQNNSFIESFIDYIKKNYKEKTIIKAFELDGSIDTLWDKINERIEKKLQKTSMINAASKVISSDLKDLANSFSQAKSFLWNIFSFWSDDKVWELNALWTEFETHLLDGSLETWMISNKMVASPTLAPIIPLQPQTLPVSESEISHEDHDHDHNHEVQGTDTNTLLEMLWGSKEKVEELIVPVEFLGKKLNINKYMISALQQAELDIKNDPEASAYVIKSIWWWNWRNKRWGTTLSNHALWLAIDINPATNKFYPNGIDQSRRWDFYDIPDSFVSIMKHHGFIRWWDWKKPFDGMHFEYSNKELLEKAKNNVLSNVA